jgi:hypothetical protein
MTRDGHGIPDIKKQVFEVIRSISHAVRDAM